MKIYIIGVLTGLFLVGNSLYGQPVNDDCNKPIKLIGIANYCSKVGEFSNVGATPSGYTPAFCWPNTNNDVWFSFVAEGSDIQITVIGRKTQGTPGGTLSSMSGALYSGTCGGSISQLSCFSDVNNSGIISFSRAGLIIGQRYFIRIDGRNGNTGTFQLCINNFFPPAKFEQDCRTATVLCNTNPFVNKAFRGAGVFTNEAAGSCLGEGGGIGNSEQASVWYTWIAKNDCRLTFTLTPLNSGDDLDFALYELPSGIHNCNDKLLLRCNASAPPCTNKTGLNLSSNDISENFNCDPGEDGFSRFADVTAGKAYALIINNFTATGIGFSMEWGSECEFQGPDAQFTISPEIGLRCETDFKVEDFSTFAVGKIDSFIWNFGVDARPQTANTKGPHKVFYNSIGEKYITLTLVTDLGCRITTVKRILAEPCCEDLPDIEIIIDSIIDVKCHGEKNGRVVFSGNLGNPYTEQGTGRQYYTFSLDGIDYLDVNQFSNLPAGTYTLYIQDRKGCVNEIQFTIKEPEKIIVNAETDLEILLGDFVDISGNAAPSDFYNYDWYYKDSLICSNCQNTRIQPLKDGFYKLVATDSKGCNGADSIFIRVRREYNVYTPNVFSPNDDGVNDFFNVDGNAALESLEKIEIFDRWGGKTYSREKVPRSEFNKLWNGRFNGKEANPGVFTYRIAARFIDGTVQEVGGDLTLLR